ncbi:MAG: hypothetical protein QM612_02790 [Thermomonas sp.]|uniref:hypothetical protein n=1 Tax=Thermomonas sp. TaxID=1971895 RepID=UPI0039E34488
MQYTYTFNLHPNRLPVTVFVGIDSEWKLPYPHLWTGSDRAEVWYPQGCFPVDHSAVSHEGVHLATWGLGVLPHDSFRQLIPANDMCWRSKRATREEAMARMVDRHVDNFYAQAQRHGLQVVGPKVTELLRTVDMEGFYGG